MVPRLSILHQVFLNKLQRYAIGNENDAEVQSIGVSVPVWYRPKRNGTQISISTSEPAEEIICKYIISNSSSEQVIEVDDDDGYKIYLSKNMASKLLGVKDRGAEGVSFRHYSTINVGGIMYRAIHHISIKDEDELLGTLTAE